MPVKDVSGLITFRAYLRKEARVLRPFARTRWAVSLQQEEG